MKAELQYDSHNSKDDLIYLDLDLRHLAESFEALVAYLTAQIADTIDSVMRDKQRALRAWVAGVGGVIVAEEM